MTVTESFTRLHQGAAIEKVETSSFKGKIGQYRLSYRATNGLSGTEVFKPDGKRIDPPGEFRPQ